MSFLSFFPLLAQSMSAGGQRDQVISALCVSHVLWIKFHFLRFVFWTLAFTPQHTPYKDLPAARPSPSRSSSQPAQRTRQTGFWWQTPRAWARGRWWCWTWRRRCVSPTSGESPRRGDGVYSRCCCWRVQTLQSGQEGRGYKIMQWEWQAAGSTQAQQSGEVAAANYAASCYSSTRNRNASFSVRDKLT